MYRFNRLNTQVVKLRRQVCIYAKQTRQTRQNNTNPSIDNSIIGLGISVCSSIVALSVCTVAVLTLREASFETEKLHEEYDKLKEEIELLKDKDVKHELVINAVVNELLELRNIGIL